MHSLKQFFKQKNLMFEIGMILCLSWLIIALFAPLIAPCDPYVQDVSIGYQKPSVQHWFGTDELGRDVFSRVLYAREFPSQ